MATLDEQRLEAFLDGLALGQLERQRYEADFPYVPSPIEESLNDWFYNDADE